MPGRVVCGPQTCISVPLINVWQQCPFLSSSSSYNKTLRNPHQPIKTSLITFGGTSYWHPPLQEHCRALLTSYAIQPWGAHSNGSISSLYFPVPRPLTSFLYSLSSSPSRNVLAVPSNRCGGEVSLQIFDTWGFTRRSRLLGTTRLNWVQSSWWRWQVWMMMTFK